MLSQKVILRLIYGCSVTLYIPQLLLNLQSKFIFLLNGYDAMKCLLFIACYFWKVLWKQTSKDSCQNRIVRNIKLTRVRYIKYFRIGKLSRLRVINFYYFEQVVSCCRVKRGHSSFFLHYFLKKSLLEKYI